MQLISTHLLAVQILLGLAAGAAVSIPARDASPLPAAEDYTTNLPLPTRDTSNPSIKFTRLPDLEIDSRDANTSPNPNPNLSKRLTYNPNAGPGQNFYCGESPGMVVSTTSTSPLKSDCLAIRAQYAEPVRGYWTVTVADQTSAPGGWITLATYGTCAFKVKYEDGQVAKDFRFGSDDVWFSTGYIREYAGDRFEGVSNVWCSWNQQGSSIRWGLLKP